MTSFLPRLLLAALFAALAAVLGWPNLWLDEVLQLVGTLRTSFGQMLAWVATQPGGGPLGYLVQWAALAVFGFSSFTARLPALAAAAVGCVLLARLAAHKRAADQHEHRLGLAEAEAREPRARLCRLRVVVPELGETGLSLWSLVPGLG